MQPPNGRTLWVQVELLVMLGGHGRERAALRVHLVGWSASIFAMTVVHARPSAIRHAISHVVRGFQCPMRMRWVHSRVSRVNGRSDSLIHIAKFPKLEIGDVELKVCENQSAAHIKPEKVL